MTAETFMLIFATTFGVSTVPGLTDAECAFMAMQAPLVVAQQSRTSGVPVRLIEARCERSA
jgi:hypothetical protein